MQWDIFYFTKGSCTIIGLEHFKEITYKASELFPASFSVPKKAQKKGCDRKIVYLPKDK